jgi:hypothetical protein
MKTIIRSPTAILVAASMVAVPGVGSMDSASAASPQWTQRCIASSPAEPAAPRSLRFVTTGDSARRQEQHRERVILLHDNDLHFTTNHREAVRAVIEEVRRQNVNVFLLNAGDLFVRHEHRWPVGSDLDTRMAPRRVPGWAGPRPYCGRRPSRRLWASWSPSVLRPPIGDGPSLRLTGRLRRAYFRIRDRISPLEAVSAGKHMSHHEAT